MAWVRSMPGCCGGHSLIWAGILVGRISWKGLAGRTVAMAVG